MNGRKVRVSVVGPADVVIKLGDEGIASIEPQRTGEHVTIQGAGFEVLVDGWRFEARVEDARHAALRERAERQAAEHTPTAASTVRAQLPGRVVRVWVTAEEEVEPGQRLLSVEAMKMENEIRSPQAGRVENVRVAAGQRVELGDELLTIA